MIYMKVCGEFLFFLFLIVDFILVIGEMFRGRLVLGLLRVVVLVLLLLRSVLVVDGGVVCVVVVIGGVGSCLFVLFGGV